jgi:hypothetical protein
MNGLLQTSLHAYFRRKAERARSRMLMRSLEHTILKRKHFILGIEVLLFLYKYTLSLSQGLGHMSWSNVTTNYFLK